MSDPIVIFRTRSESEARVVCGLLDTHGIQTVMSADVPHSVFPLGEVRISVRADEADLARQVIDSHRRDDSTGMVVSIRDEFQSLEHLVGYRFRDRGLLEHAMTHRSRAHEDVTGGVRDNESLEFLGDAVLGFIIADLLFREFPEFDEGQKSKLKASLVSASTLARVGRALGLGEHLILGRGEEKTGGRRKHALLADACEALIASIYLDGGIEAARAFIERAFGSFVDEIRQGRAAVAAAHDFKSALQELLQSRDRSVPEYRTVGESGPDHDKVFAVEVWVGNSLLASAEGRSKKEAEQQAARLALETLQA